MRQVENQALTVQNPSGVTNIVLSPSEDFALSARSLECRALAPQPFRPRLPATKLRMNSANTINLRRSQPHCWLLERYEQFSLIPVSLQRLQLSNALGAGVGLCATFRV